MIFIAIIAGATGSPVDDSKIDDANLYMDWIVDSVLQKNIGHLDPLVTYNFQPYNGHHRDMSIRFVHFNVTGLSHFARHGNCDPIESDGSGIASVKCELVTHLHYLVVVDVTFKGVTTKNVTLTGTFLNVKGPVTIRMQKSKTVSVEFSPYFDENAWNFDEIEHKFGKMPIRRELHAKLITMFDFVTRIVFRREMFHATQRVPFPY